MHLPTCTSIYIHVFYSREFYSPCNNYLSILDIDTKEREKQRARKEIYIYVKNNRGVRIWFGGGLALEIEGDVCVTLAEVVKRVASIISPVRLGRIRYLEREQISVLPGRLAWHLDTFAVGDRLLTLVPSYIRDRVSFQDTLHDQHVPFLSNCWLLWETRWFTVRYSASDRHVRSILASIPRFARTDSFQGVARKNNSIVQNSSNFRFFEIRSFEIRLFEIRSFEIQSFKIWSLEIQSFKIRLFKI